MSFSMDRASQTLMALIGAGAVTASLMPAAEAVLIEPAHNSSQFVCRICANTVERGRPDLHNPKLCVLAVARPGHGVEP